MMYRLLTYGLFIILLPGVIACTNSNASEDAESAHPLLILQKKDVSILKSGREIYPLLKHSYEEAKQIADNAIQSGIVVPFPKDPGGGYTHEKHKNNYIEMYYSALVYQLGGDAKYADFVRDMLNAYADLYPTLGIHPMQKNQAPGKLFWQGLNESVWLVYSIQAYDCIYEYLTPSERNHIETKLFRKVVEFFTQEDPYSFNRIHNHGTWAVAGVGMTGMVLGDSTMIKQALYSTDLDGSGGFLLQIDKLFSPDGYYAEGPYYQRYALMPFIIFAKALDNNLPDLKIFDYKNGVLTKAVTTLLQLTAPDGNFFPFNDAIKDKSWLSAELIFGTDIIYGLNADPHLLDVANEHGKVMLSVDGYKVAKDTHEGKLEKFVRHPMLIGDGSDGEDGGVALLRIGEKAAQSTVVYKFSSQGMGHGHFDRLAYLLYDNGNEIMPDYGAARFLNVLAKEGGRYLPENTTWAKQTVAHNTLVVNEESNFMGDAKIADLSSPKLNFSQLISDTFQIVSATDSLCYKDAKLTRTLALIKLDGRKYMVDLFEADCEKVCKLDLPLYYNGQVMAANFKFDKPQILKSLGSKNAYQHLWVEGQANNLPETASVTWMHKTGFYTLSFLTTSSTSFNFTRLGANDPDYNLRHQGGFMIRNEGNGKQYILSVIEMHGNYNPVSESVMQSEGSVKYLKLDNSEHNNKKIEMGLKNDKTVQLLIDKNGGRIIVN